MSTISVGVKHEVTRKVSGHGNLHIIEHGGCMTELRYVEDGETFSFMLTETKVEQLHDLLGEVRAHNDAALGAKLKAV